MRAFKVVKPHLLFEILFQSISMWYFVKQSMNVCQEYSELDPFLVIIFSEICLNRELVNLQGIVLWIRLTVNSYIL